jgi:uncharacterized protein YndB with AHSA1/START domain
MTHPFELHEEISLDATPEQVWAAIATGPGIDSWFMGRSEIEGRDGGRTTMSLAGFEQSATVTAWEEGKRFALRSDANPDGSFMAFEYLIEGRDGGSTVLRFVHSGLLGDDWEAEYDGLSTGDLMYLRKLAVYLAHFGDRTSTYNMFLIGPLVADKAAAFRGFGSAFGLDPADIRDGAAATVAVAGLPAASGVVEFANDPIYLGVRTDDGLYAFIHGYQDAIVLEYHAFNDDVDPAVLESAWQAWLTTAFGATTKEG